MYMNNLSPQGFAYLYQVGYCIVALHGNMFALCISANICVNTSHTSDDLHMKIMNILMTVITQLWWK